MEVTKEEQEAAWFTLHEVVKGVLLLLAPITPYITDYVWRKSYGPQTIHLEKFSKPKGYDVSEKTSQGILELNAQVWSREGQGTHPARRDSRQGPDQPEALREAWLGCTTSSRSRSQILVPLTAIRMLRS